MATIAIEGERGVAVGRVFGRAFAAIGHNPVPVAAVAILFAALPGCASDYLLTRIPWDAMVMTVGSLTLPGVIPKIFASWFLGIVIGSLTQAAMTRPLVAESEQRKGGLNECLAAALRVVFPSLILGAIMGVAILIGVTLLIIPGILIYALWCVAASALADEREGAFMALGRSQELGEGARWKILGIILVMDVMVFLLSSLFGLLSLLLFGAEGSSNPLALGVILLTALLYAAWYVIVGSILASLYVELKRWKEGDSVDTLEQVFA